MVAGVSLPADIFFARYHLSSEGSTGAAYSPMVDGEVLTFEWDNGTMRDEQTGSIWNFAGPVFNSEIKVEVGKRVARDGFCFANLVLGRV